LYYLYGYGYPSLLYRIKKGIAIPADKDYLSSKILPPLSLLSAKLY